MSNIAWIQSYNLTIGKEISKNFVQNFEFCEQNAKFCKQNEKM